MCNAAGNAAGRAKTNAEPILREDETLREHSACVIWRWLASLRVRDVENALRRDERPIRARLKDDKHLGRRSLDDRLIIPLRVHKPRLDPRSYRRKAARELLLQLWRMGIF